MQTSQKGDSPPSASPPKDSPVLKKREEEWNSRFNVASTIPPYNPILDPHAKSYQRVIEDQQLKKLAKQDPLLHQQKQPLPAAFQLGVNEDDWQRRRARLIEDRLGVEATDSGKTNQRTKQLIRKAEMAWSGSDIPGFIGYYFLKYLKGINADLANSLLLEEIRTIYSKENSYYQLAEALKAREFCLVSIQELIQQLTALRGKDRLQATKDESDGYKRIAKAGQEQSLRDVQYSSKTVSLFDQLKNLRKLSLLFLQRLTSWRKSLRAMNSKGDFRVPKSEVPVFFHQGQNYALKMLNDSYPMLQNTFLADYLEFTPNDPFLLHPLRSPLSPSKSHRDQSKERQQYIFLLTQDQSAIKSMDSALQLLAEQKAAQLRDRMTIVEVNESAPKRGYSSKAASIQRLQKIYSSSRKKLQPYQQASKLKDTKPKFQMQGFGLNGLQDIQQLAEISQVTDKKEAGRLKLIKRHQDRLDAIKKVYRQKSKQAYFNPDGFPQLKSKQLQPEMTSSNPTSQPFAVYNQPLAAASTQKQKSTSLLTKPKPAKEKQPSAGYSDFQKLVRKKEIEVLKQLGKRKDEVKPQPKMQSPEDEELQSIINLYRNDSAAEPNALGLKQVRAELRQAAGAVYQLQQQRKSKRRSPSKDKDVTKKVFRVQTKTFRDQQFRRTARASSQAKIGNSTNKIEIPNGAAQLVEELKQQSAKNRLRAQVNQAKRATVSDNEEGMKKRMKDQIRQSLQEQLRQKKALQDKMMREEQAKYQNLKKALKDELEREMSLQKARRQVEKMEIEKRVKQQELRLEAERARFQQLMRERERIQRQRIEKEAAQRQRDIKSLIEQEQAQRRDAQKKGQQQARRRNDAEKQLAQGKLRQQIQKQMRKQLQEKLQEEQLALKQNLEKESETRRMGLQRQLQQIRKARQVQIDSVVVEPQVREKMVRELREKEEKKRAQLEKELFEFQFRENERLSKQSRVRRDELESMIARTNIKGREAEAQQSPLLERQQRMALIAKATAELEQAQKARSLSPEFRDAAFRKQLIENSMVSKNVEREIAKNQLRSQFQRQLFQIAQGANTAIRSQQHQEQKELKEAGLKPIHLYNSDEYLKNKMAQLEISRQVKPQGNNFQSSMQSFRPPPPTASDFGREGFASPARRLTSNQIYKARQSPERQAAGNRLGMTPEQYQVYLRKKRQVKRQDSVLDHQSVRLPGSQSKELLLARQKGQLDKVQAQNADRLRKIEQQKKAAQARMQEQRRRHRQEEDMLTRQIEMQKRRLAMEQERIRREWQDQKRRMSEQKDLERRKKEARLAQKKERQRKKQEKQARQLKRLQRLERKLRDSPQDSEDSYDSQEQRRRRRRKKRREESEDQESEHQQRRKRDDQSSRKRDSQKGRKRNQLQQQVKEARRDAEQTQRKKKEEIQAQRLELDREQADLQRKKALQRIQKEKNERLRDLQDRQREIDNKRRILEQKRAEAEQHLREADSMANLDIRSNASQTISIQPIKVPQKNGPKDIGQYKGKAQAKQKPQFNPKEKNPQQPSQSPAKGQAQPSPQRPDRTISEKKTMQISKRLTMVALPSKLLQNFDTQISVETLEQKGLIAFSEKVFSQIPAEQVACSLYKKEELSRKMFSQLAFTYLVGREKHGMETGLAVVHHDRVKVETRRFIIDFICCYKGEDFFSFFLKVGNYVFRKDPCDQIQLVLESRDGADEDSLAFLKAFSEQFQKVGNIYEKRLEAKVERKYVVRRPFNLKCEVAVQPQHRNPFNSIIRYSSNLLISDHQLGVDKSQVRQEAEKQVSYSLQLSEHFRNNLVPEEAEVLKARVKESLKLKQLLVLVVQLQKKKVLVEQVGCEQFKSLVELNMRLLSQGRDTLKMLRDSHLSNNRIFHLQINQEFKMPFDFHTSTLPFESRSLVRHFSYFRLAPHPNFKLHTLKSALYSETFHVLPTENPQYKILLFNAQEFLKLPNGTDLFMYVRMFMKNVRSHSQANWRYVWIPAFRGEAVWKVRELSPILPKDMYAWDRSVFDYKEFMPSSLLIEPTHKDLVVASPFVVGVLSIGLEQTTEGTPLYLRLLQEEDLVLFEEEQKQP